MYLCEVIYLGGILQKVAVKDTPIKALRSGAEFIYNNTSAKLALSAQYIITDLDSLEVYSKFYRDFAKLNNWVASIKKAKES